MIFWQCRRTFGKTWGLAPKMVHWIYTSIVRPYLAYGIIAWWPRLELDTSKKLLSKIQRLACIGITSAMKSTPTAALEVLLDLPPLHLFLEGELSRSLCRVSLVLKRRVLYATGTRRSTRIQDFIDSIAGDLTVETDTVIPTLSFDRNYSCFIPERTQWDQECCDEIHFVICIGQATSKLSSYHKNYILFGIQTNQTYNKIIILN